MPCRPASRNSRIRRPAQSRSGRSRSAESCWMSSRRGMTITALPFWGYRGYRTSPVTRATPGKISRRYHAQNARRQGAAATPSRDRHLIRQNLAILYSSPHRILTERACRAGLRRRHCRDDAYCPPEVATPADCGAWPASGHIVGCRRTSFGCPSRRALCLTSRPTSAMARRPFDLRPLDPDSPPQYRSATPMMRGRHLRRPIRSGCRPHVARSEPVECGHLRMRRSLATRNARTAACSIRMQRQDIVDTLT